MSETQPVSIAVALCLQRTSALGLGVLMGACVATAPVSDRTTASPSSTTTSSTSQVYEAPVSTTVTPQPDTPAREAVYAEPRNTATPTEVTTTSGKTPERDPVAPPARRSTHPAPATATKPKPAKTPTASSSPGTPPATAQINTLPPPASGPASVDVAAESNDPPGTQEPTASLDEGPGSQERAASEPEEAQAASSTTTDPSVGPTESEPGDSSSDALAGPAADSEPSDVPLDIDRLPDDRQPLLAMREPLTVTPPAKEQLELTLAMLPLEFGGRWKLDRTINPVTGKTECLLASEAADIFDGYDRTKVRVHVSSASIYVETGSNVDLSYPETGLRLDNGTLNPFERVEKHKNAVISAQAGDVLAQMANASDMVVRLGFWPTWPVTSTREIRFPLAQFPSALRALKACDEM